MQEEKQTSSAFEMLRAVWNRRRWVALVAFVVPMTGAMTLSSSLPNIYESTAMVIVQHKSAVASGEPDTANLETRLHTLSQANLSRSRLEELIRRFDLYPELRRRGSMEAVAARMKKDVQLELQDIEQAWGRSTVALTVKYRGAHPDTVAQVTNALAAYYVDQNQKQRERDASETVAALEKQLEQMRKRLSEEEGRIRGFKEKHLHELPEQVAVNLSSIDRIMTELELNRERQRTAEETRRRLAQELADISGNTPVGGVEDVSSKIARLTRELRDLRSRYTEHHPDVVRVKTELAALSSGKSVKSPYDGEGKGDGQFSASGQTRERLTAVLRQTENELRQLQSYERQMQARLDTHQGQIYAAPRRDQELQSLLPTYDTIRAQYNRLLTQYSDARLAKTAPPSQGEPFEIVDPAIASKMPAGPNRLRLIIIGFMASLMLALAAVVVAEQRDTSFHSLDELRDFTRVPVLVSVPRITTADDLRRTRQRSVLGLVLLGMVLVGVAGGAFAYGHDNQDLVSSLTKGKAKAQ